MLNIDFYKIFCIDFNLFKVYDSLGWLLKRHGLIQWQWFSTLIHMHKYVDIKLNGTIDPVCLSHYFNEYKPSKIKQNYVFFLVVVVVVVAFRHSLAIYTIDLRLLLPPSTPHCTPAQLHDDQFWMKRFIIRWKIVALLIIDH